MAKTNDHAEIADLRKVIGLSSEEKKDVDEGMPTEAAVEAPKPVETAPVET